MEKVLLEETYVLEYIKDILNNSKIKPKEIEGAKYHHNSDYIDAPSIIKNGIYSISGLHKNGIKFFSDEIMHVLNDEQSHVNGNDEISLAVVGLKDLYPGEEEYDPHGEAVVDFLVASDVKTRRSSINYGNEYLASNFIEQQKLRSVDVRILKHLEKTNNIRSIIEKYNILREIALTLKETNLNIPLREASSNEAIELDIDSLIEKPVVLLKK